MTSREFLRWLRDAGVCLVWLVRSEGVCGAALVVAGLFCILTTDDDE